MTKDILLSDVDLADRLIRAERPDSEIVAALLKRGVEEGKASKLVHDLRHGVRIALDLYATPVLKEPRLPQHSEQKLRWAGA